MSLKCPFCPDFCPVGPSNKHFYKVKFVDTVLFALTSETINMVKRVCRDCPIPHCGAKYLVKLSNHLDYIQRRKWLQEAKLQPKIRVVIYPAKASQEFRMRSKSQTTPVKQQGGKKKKKKKKKKPLLIYTAQGSPLRCKKLSVINGSPEHNNVLKL